jgi:ABC-type transport system involved in multi-copper enzyme maturation permease subunit
MRWGPGPVFVYECVTNARRWQTYAARSLGVAALLLGMVTMAWSNEGILQGNSAQEYARLGEKYFYVLIGVELSLVMLAAPAATAGAICMDRARGTLTHILATDLSDSEIVLGKLAARLLPVMGLVACTWPVMAISSLLGGIDPLILNMAFGVIVAVAVLGCSLALALSVWAKKPHDVVAVVYILWAIIILAYPVMWLMALARLVVGPPRWLLLADPFYLAFAPYIASGSVDLADFLWFLAVTLAASAAIVLAAVWRMRPVSARGTGGGTEMKQLAALGRITRWLPGPSLDWSPVLWREWHRARPIGWITVFGVLIWMITTIACAFAACTILRLGATPTKPAIAAAIAGLVGEILQVNFGLLLLSVSAPMSLSGERQRSSLDVLVVTPLLTRSIVMGKWLGAFRIVPLFAIGPGLIMLALVAVDYRELSLRFRLLRFGLMVAMVLVHGAWIASLGLAVATWIKGHSRAIAFSVCAFVLVSVAWPITAYVAGPWRYASGLAALSPITAAALLFDKGMIRGDVWNFHLWVTFWDVMVAYGAFALLFLTIHSFDRYFDRMPDQVRRSPPSADLVALFAGGIAIACAAGAIVAWFNGLYPESLSFESLIGLLGAAVMIMVVASLLPAVATFTVPVDGSDHAAAVTLACWWRAARLALALTLGPGLIAISLATARAAPESMAATTLPTHLPAFGPADLGYRLIDVVLLVATLFVQGAVISALALALYVWTKRRQRAIAQSAGLFLVAAIAWPLLIWYSPTAIPVHGLSMLSFLSVSSSLAAELVTREPQYPGLFAWAIFRIVFLTLFTIGLLWRTTRTLDQRAAQPRARDLLVESGSILNQRVLRSRALVRKVP